MKKIYLVKLLVIVGIIYGQVALAQTITLSPSSVSVPTNTNFSVNVNIASVTNLFGVAFDLNFNPAYVDFVSATEGSFMNQGCQTSLMTTENPAGKLIFGLTRLGASCGGLSGAGTLVTLNFRSLSQSGSTNLTFSNNSLCILSGSICNFITGTWTGGSATVGVVDTQPPAPPGGVIVI